MVYDIYGIDIHTKGDLKGYVTGLITFITVVKRVIMNFIQDICR